MTYKQIETSREIRLWISQVIVPATVAVATLMTIPEVRETTKVKINEAKRSIKKKLKKYQGPIYRALLFSSKWNSRKKHVPL